MDNSKIKKTCEALEEHIEMLTRKRGSMSPQDIELLCKDLCAMESLKRLEEGGGGYSEAHSGDSSYRRGRAMDGRFTSRDGGGGSGSSGYYDGGLGGSSARYYDGGSGNSGYSGHSKKDRLIDHIEHLMDAAQNEQERQFLRNWLDRINNS